MAEWTEGVCGDGAAILRDGEPVSISALLSVLNSREWQPISTAPKDGSWFMICRASEGLETCEVGRYSPRMWDTYEPTEDGLYRKVPVPISDWDGFNNFHRATHWMPLTEPPTEGTP